MSVETRVRGRVPRSALDGGIGADVLADAFVLERVGGLTPEEIAALTDEEKMVLARALDELVDTGQSPTADALSDLDYRWEPVSMAQFLDDPYYLGQFTTDLFPAWRQALTGEVFDTDAPPVEVVLGGSLGCGKTTCAGLGMLYDAYRLGALRDPHRYHGIMAGSRIVFAMYSVSKEQAADSAFSKIVTWVEGSPFFRERMPKVGRHVTKLQFGGTPIQFITGSQEVHAIGKDMYSFLLDEANFLTSKNGAQDETTRAYAIYANARNRLKSRFMKGGRIPGKVWLISSKRTHASFLEKHIADSKEEISAGRTRLYEYSQWAVRDPSEYVKPRFRVEIGDRIYPSRILEPGDEPRVGGDVIEVPGEFLTEFQLNIDGAIRDIAGRATESICPLIHDRRAVHDCVDTNLVHPFTRPAITLSDGDEYSLSDYFDRKVMFDIRLGRYTPRYNPTMPRFIHLDPAFTGDSLGMACCHISGYRQVRRPRVDGTMYTDRAPIVTVDFMLQVTPPKRGQEIELAKVRAFIINLREMGLPIWRVTADSIMGRDLIQVMRRLDFDAQPYSVDKTDDAYVTLKQAIMERRIRYYAYEVFTREVCELERNIEEGKVDHPKTSPSTGKAGSKDVSDAVAGAAFQAIIDLKAAGVDAPDEDAPAGAGRIIQTSRGHIAWDQLERDAR